MGYTLTSGFCQKNKMILDHLFNLLKNADEETLDIFWSWVTRRPYEEIKL